MSGHFIASRQTSCLVAALLCCVAGCKSGPDYRSPDVEVPQKFAGAEPEAEAAPVLAGDWWKVFDDARLDELESAALAANQDLRAAAARVVQARAASEGVASQFYPVVTFDPSITRGRTQVNGQSVTGNVVRIPFDVSYEVDIWGRVRRAHEASQAQWHATAAEFGVVMQTLEADVAQNWFLLRSLDQQDEILKRSIELYSRQVELTQTRQRVGVAGSTDVLQAQAQLENARALESDTARQRADLEHALAILIGRPPSELALEVSVLAGTPPAIPPGLPAQLLERRPDVREAEQNLIAANALVGVADASFRPTLLLTGSAGFESIDVTHAIDWANRFWSIGAGLTAPIFEGGRLTAELEQAKASYDEALASYRSAVLSAFGEVEDALTDLHHRADASTAQERSIAASREYVRLARMQYDQGLIGYLQVIDAERTLLNGELSAAEIAGQRFVSTVLLIKALGGGWTPATSDDDPRTQKAEGPR